MIGFVGTHGEATHAISDRLKSRPAFWLSGQAASKDASPEGLGRLPIAEGARYVTAVCTGSLILAAAGLLRGRRAASHWMWRDHLALFGAIPDPARVVHDGRFFTGGGVTAGIDFALALVAEIAGDAAAQAIQLGFEYAPAPPFDAGRPELAPPHVVEWVLAKAGDMGDRVAALVAAAGRAEAGQMSHPSTFMHEAH